MLAWFGGITVDLRQVELAPGARLSLHTLFGGIQIKTPPGWRVESGLKAIAGGVDARTPAQDDPDAPVLTLTGTALFGGIAVGAKASGEDRTDGAGARLAQASRRHPREVTGYFDLTYRSLSTNAARLSAGAGCGLRILSCLCPSGLRLRGPLS